MADRYLRAGGPWNYNNAAAWELTPGGGESVAVPSATDAVKFTATSGNLTVTAAAAAQTIDFTNYVGTFVINASQTLTVSGSVTLAAGMTWTATTGTISTGTAGTWTFNGVKIPCAWTISGAVAITLADAAEVDGTFTCSNNGTTTLNGAIRCNGSVSLQGTTAGTSDLRFGGTGTWTGNNNSGRRVQKGIVIDTAGTLTLGSGIYIGNGTVLTYVAGTITASNAIQINGATTLDVDNAAMHGVSWSIGGTTTLTLSNPLTCNQFGVGSNTTMVGAHAVTCTTLLFFATATLTRVNSWTVGTLQVNSGSFTATLAGAFDQQVTDYYVFSGATVALTSGQTLTITGVMFKTGNGSTATATLRSVTASSPITLDYQGGEANSRIFRATFTDVNMAAGQTLWNYHGQTLTRTNGIRNFTRTPRPRAAAVAA